MVESSSSSSSSSSSPSSSSCSFDRSFVGRFLLRVRRSNQIETASRQPVLTLSHSSCSHLVNGFFGHFSSALHLLHLLRLLFCFYFFLCLSDRGRSIVSAPQLVGNSFFDRFFIAIFIANLKDKRNKGVRFEFCFFFFFFFF